MAITNCTVFDSSYSQSYSVIDYPRCPDDLVKADIPSGSDQEKVLKAGWNHGYERSCLNMDVKLPEFSCPFSCLEFSCLEFSCPFLGFILIQLFIDFWILL